jgi:hypothetical protein
MKKTNQQSTPSVPGTGTTRGREKEVCVCHAKTAKPQPQIINIKHQMKAMRNQRQWSVLLLLTLTSTSTVAFAFLVPRSLSRSIHGKAFLPSSSLASSSSSTSSFDFSSTHGWEDYYHNNTQAVEEWHSDMSLSSLASLVPPSSHCLVVGCGTSHMPRYLLDRSVLHLTLLDSSKSCIHLLQERYGSSVNYVCGDATSLSSHVAEVDVIFDKGLMDALLCGEGWDYTVQRLLQQAQEVLVTEGRYILVSYRLAPSTKDFLLQQEGWEWEFDINLSTERVGVSIATKVRRH